MKKSITYGIFLVLTVFFIASTTLVDQVLAQNLTQTGAYEGTWDIGSNSGDIKFSLSVQKDGTLTGKVLDVSGEVHSFSTSFVGEIQGSTIRINDLAGHSLNGTLIEGRITGDYCGWQCGSLDVRKVAD